MLANATTGGSYKPLARSNTKNTKNIYIDFSDPAPVIPVLNSADSFSATF